MVEKKSDQTIFDEVTSFNRVTFRWFGEFFKLPLLTQDEEMAMVWCDLTESVIQQRFSKPNLFCASFSGM